MQFFGIVVLLLALFTTTSVAAQNVSQLARNPLLRGTVLPLFAEISHEHVTEAVQHLVKLTEGKIKAIEQDEATDFASLFDVLAELNIASSRILSPLDHLQMVRNDKKIRPLHEKAKKQLTVLTSKIAQNPVIYRKLLALENDPSLTAVQQRMVKLRLDVARGLGVGLEGEERERFNDLSEELAKLRIDFANNILDATKAFQLVLRDKNEIAGLPASFLARAAQNYAENKKENATAEAGPWLITLDLPSYLPFMDYSERRDLREKIYRAYVSIATHKSHDNTPIIKRILQLRQEQAQLLGFSHHAERVLSTKMAGNVANVKQLLDELHETGYPNMLEEKEQLNAYANDNGAPDELAPWDTAYWARRMKEEQLNLDPEALRQYFPLPRVMDGLFGLLSQIFSISIEENTTGVQVWHDDVKFYQVRDADGTHIASFYFDPYSRPQNKNGGAWMNTCNSRHVNGEVLEIPVCYVVANFSPPTGDKPSLLDMREVETLFHEFGHAMHELLTTVEHNEISGLSGVEWDAVEMPSSFMENFIFLDRVIPTISSHVESGAALPAAMVERLRQLQNFRVASQLQRQLNFGYIDIQLHTDFDANTQDPLALMREVYEYTHAVPPLDTDQYINSFRHIFAGGYAANYYSYKLGEVLAADAFAMFVENGFDDEGLQHSGRQFRDKVLALGGSKSAQDIFIELRGRLPSPQALLRQYGLLEEQ